MKSLRIFTIAVVILNISLCASCQSRKTVSGNGNVVVQERKIQPFTGLNVSTGVDVFLKQGDNNEVLKVEADENLQEYILTEVKGGVLNVYTDANIRHAEKKVVYVTMKEIKSVKTSSAGDVVGETPVQSESLELSASSAGNIKLDVTAKKIDVNISSSGDVTLTGKTDMLEADLSSAGDLNANDLIATEANISASSAGDAEINVLEKLTAKASSAGDINYSGEPEYVNANSSSAGSIRSR
jgi:hypothetical protein